MPETVNSSLIIKFSADMNITVPSTAISIFAASPPTIKGIGHLSISS
jgi:hypothetical protein